MRRLGIFGAAVALVVAFGANGACAQTATAEPAGKPLALLAGLRPPHEVRHKYSKHVVHAISHARAVHEKAAARTRHARTAAAHTRRFTAKRLAKREYEHRERRYEHHEQPVTASAFAEEPPVQAAANATLDSLTPAPVHPAANEGPADGASATAAEPAIAPLSQTTPPNGQTDNGNANAGPEPARIQAIKITASPNAVSAPAVTNVASSAAMPDASAVAAAAQEQRATKTDPVGSASWIAQVLAALGGAVTAGAVAWFLIGGGPARTYG